MNTRKLLPLAALLVMAAPAALWCSEAHAQSTQKTYQCKVTDSTGKTVQEQLIGPMLSSTSDVFSVSASSEADASTKAIAAANKQRPNAAVAACCREKAKESQSSA